MSARGQGGKVSVAFAATAGVLFGAGLLIAGMTHPARAIGFLDLAGGWDPTLAFVITGAIAVYAFVYRRIQRRRSPWFDRQFHVPHNRQIDGKLVGGAALFGVGWGLAGLCPGSALVSLGAGSLTALAFVAAMVGGAELHRAFAGER